MLKLRGDAARLRGGIGQTKVGRYWPGKAPKWAEEAEEDHEDGVSLHKKVGVLDDDVSLHKKVGVLDDDLEVSRNKDDPRLRRLAQTTRTENRKRVRADHCRVRQAAEVISTEEGLKNQEIIDEEQDEDALEERRRRIREKNLKRVREETDLLPVEEEEEEEEEEELQEEEEESAYETDSEDEIMFGINMMKPVFVPKAGRDTVVQRERLEAEEEALQKLAKRKLEMRKIEAKQIVVEEVRKDKEIQKNVLLEEANIGDVETDNEINEAEEYEAWKTREVARIKREEDAREAMSREKEEIDKLRNMTEQERNNPKPSLSSSVKPKRQWKFMQRYYHKGAFFQEPGSVETNGILQPDYSAPTGEDKLDKKVLRENMQVKHFGRSRRTKWTHLVNEDTTYGGKNKKDEEKPKDWSDPWVSNGLLRQKFIKKMAAMDAPIARPKGSKKMKVW